MYKVFTSVKETVVQTSIIRGRIIKLQRYSLHCGVGVLLHCEICLPE